MNAFLWKAYFWLNVVLLGLIVIVQMAESYMPIGPFIAEGVLYVLSIIGLYSYIFKKPFFDTRFWKYFFWFNVLYLIAFLTYCAFPETPILSNFSNFMYETPENLLLEGILSGIFGIPLLFANYKIAQGTYFVPKTKKQEEKEVGTLRWGMIQTALWGYATVFLLMALILSFVPTTSTVTTTNNPSDMISGMAIFAPILLFWAWIAFQYKRYKWNWWKITLLLNSLLFSSLIVFGAFFSESIAAVESEGTDIIGALQILIILIGLIVFGREQFYKTPVSTSKKEKL